MKMNEGSRTTTAMVCGLLVALMMGSGCGKEQAAGPLPRAAEAGCEEGDGCGKEKAANGGVPAVEQGHEEHGDHEGHGHESVAASSLAELESMECEHAIPMYQCEECRYEAGVVKVDPSLLKRADGGGLLRTQTVARARVSATLPVTGEVALNENATVHISPSIAGIIASVAVDLGAHVKAGETVLTLASVELGKALAEYERNRTLTALSEKGYIREAKLCEQKIGSEQDMIEARMIFEQHRTDLKASEQTLHVLGLTEPDLNGTNEPAHGPAGNRLAVRAPSAGTVIERHAVAGEMAEPGRDLMLISDLSSIWVWANVQSGDLAALLAAAGRGPVPVAVTVSAFPDRVFEGTIDYIGATMNEQSRTIKVRATVANPDGALRPGMFCEVAMAIGNGPAEDVLAVPRAAVLADEGRTFVFKHWKEDFFVRQDVQTGRAFLGLVEIRAGLKEGEGIATEGAFLLKSDVLREKMGAGCAD